MMYLCIGIVLSVGMNTRQQAGYAADHINKAVLCGTRFLCYSAALGVRRETKLGIRQSAAAPTTMNTVRDSQP